MKEDIHEILYNFPFGVFQMVLLFIFTLIIFFPFWLESYVPIIMIVPFHPLCFMIGAYCLAITNKHWGYDVFHLFLSMLSLGNLIFMVVEYYSASSTNSRFSGEYFYTSAYGSNANTIVNVSATSEEYHTECILMIMVCVWVFLTLSVFDGFIAIISLCEREKDVDEVKDNKVKKKCDCSMKTSIELTMITVFAVLLFLSTFTQYILGLYYYTLSSVILNPIYYNSMLFAFVSLPFLYLPRSYMKTKTIYVKTDDDYEKIKLLGMDSQETLTSEIPLEKNKKILIIFYDVFLGLALLFNIIQLSTQAYWLSQNGCGDMTDWTCLNSISSEKLYFNFTNVEYIHYLPNTEVVEDLVSWAFADSTYIFFIIDLVNIFLGLALFISTVIYTYRILLIEGELIL